MLLAYRLYIKKAISPIPRGKRKTASCAGGYSGKLRRGKSPDGLCHGRGMQQGREQRFCPWPLQVLRDREAALRTNRWGLSISDAAEKGTPRTLKKQYSGSRMEVRKQAVQDALEFLYERLQEYFTTNGGTSI